MAFEKRGQAAIDRVVSAEDLTVERGESLLRQARRARQVQCSDQDSEQSESEDVRQDS